VLSSVRLPARLSQHRVPGTGTELIVDSAINRTGVAAAIAHARRHWPGIDHVLLCLPDHKDVDGSAAELEGLPVTAVTLAEAHLRFDRKVPEHWKRRSIASLTPETLAGLGERVLVLGTVYFTGRILDLVDADTERLFTA
jgi:dihydrofolate synthase / folylpolyglutamate synthase